jgi:hypothetical protein
VIDTPRQQIKDEGALPRAFHANIGGGLLSLPERSSDAASIAHERNCETDIRAFIARHNEKPQPYRWTRSADEIRVGMCQRTQQTESRHSPRGSVRLIPAPVR